MNYTDQTISNMVDVLKYVKAQNKDDRYNIPVTELCAWFDVSTSKIINTCRRLTKEKYLVATNKNQYKRVTENGIEWLKEIKK